MRRQRYHDVIPFSIAAAAVSESTPPGIGTSWSVGITRRSQYAPSPKPYATRSPAWNDGPFPAGGPTASTTPAASIPIAVGSDGTGYSPLR